MTERRWFPLLLSHEERRKIGTTTPSVPWDMLAPHEERAKINHGGQTLEALASRGGLGPDEVLAVLEDRKWRSMPFPEAFNEVIERSLAWREKNW